MNCEPTLECLCYETGADAAGADLDGLYSAVSERFNLLQVRIPDSTCFVVSMAYVVTEAWTFTADCTYS